MSLFSGARVQRLEITSDVGVLQLRLPGATWVVLLSGRAGARGVGVLARADLGRARALLTGERARGAAAGFLQLDDAGVWLARGEHVFCVRLPERSGTALHEEPRQVVDPAALPGEDLVDWLERGQALLERLEGSSVEAARRAVVAKVERERGRLERRVKAVAGDLARGREAEAEAEAARVFVAEAARAPRGTAALRAVDWSSGEPVARELAVDPARRPRDQIEAIFARARRLKRGALVAQARLEEAEQKQARLARLLESAAAATSTEDLVQACDAMRREDPALLPVTGVVGASASKRPAARARAERLPYRTFVSASGARLLVGRGATDNDDLTLRVARPHDLWLHAKGERGAHVVVPLSKGHDAPADLLVDAAHLAAHFSDARDEAVVDVTYAPRRYVRKPRGAAPGQVLVEREKVIVLRLDRARLATLLGREEGT